MVITYKIHRCMNQPGEIASPARAQVNKDNEYFLVPVRALEFKLAKRVRQSRPASSCSFSKLRLNLVLTHGIPLYFRGGIHVFITPTTIGPVPTLLGHAIAYRWRELPKVRRHRASSPLGSCSNGCCLSRFYHEPLNVRLSFPTPTIVSGHMRYSKSSIGDGYVSSSVLYLVSGCSPVVLPKYVLCI